MTQAARQLDATVYCLETKRPCEPVRGMDVCRCMNCMKSHPAHCDCGMCSTSRRFWATALSISRQNSL